TSAVGMAFWFDRSTGGWAPFSNQGQDPTSGCLVATVGTTTTPSLVQLTATGVILGISPDSTPPTTTATITPLPNRNGWNNADVTVRLDASDDPGGSGVKEIIHCTGTITIAVPPPLPSNCASVPGASASITVTAEGNSVISYFARDNAGNTESPGSVSLWIDKTKPVITDSRSPAATNDWNNTDVVVSFTCADTGTVQSGLDTNTVTGQTVPTEGAGQSVTDTGTCIDKAGNVADPATVGNINIDKTPPVVTCTVSPSSLWPPNHKLEPVAATVTVTDTLSGEAGFVLTSVTSSQPDAGLGPDDVPTDIQGWDLNTPDTAGQLRAERAETISEGRVYTLTYRGMDKAG